MMFRLLCERCGELVVCSSARQSERSCSVCGGALVGPVALPVPESYRQRADVLLSPHYDGAVAAHDRPAAT
jgi:hypothetical protein